MKRVFHITKIKKSLIFVYVCGGKAHTHAKRCMQGDSLGKKQMIDYMSILHVVGWAWYVCVREGVRGCRVL